MADDYIYMINPNQTLTRVDEVTIPTLEKRKATLESQLKRIPEVMHKTKSQEDMAQLHSAEKLTSSELRYVKSYLNVLEKLKSVEKCEGLEYDYEKEDEILDQIGMEMKKLKEAEKEISQAKMNLIGRSCKVSDVAKADEAEYVEDVRDLRI